MAEENLSNAEQEKKVAGGDAESSLTDQEQARKSDAGGELARPGEPQSKGETDAEATYQRGEQDEKRVGGTETGRAAEETVKSGPDAESIHQRSEAGQK